MDKNTKIKANRKKVCQCQGVKKILTSTFRFDGTNFTPAKAGLYFFAVTLEIDDDIHEGQFEIRKNDDVKCTARGDGVPGGPNYEANASCAVVIELQLTDTVHVWSVRADQVETPGQCNFSGFIIKAYN